MNKFRVDVNTTAGIRGWEYIYVLIDGVWYYSVLWKDAERSGWGVERTLFVVDGLVRSSRAAVACQSIVG